MAELPEVEIVVRDLRATLIGRTIEGADVLVPDTVRFATPDVFAHEIAGRRIMHVSRRAKWILVGLDAQSTLALHFMLFGHLRLELDSAPRESTLCLVLHLNNNEDLRLMDRLGYARVALLPAVEVEKRLGLDTLGPEILSDGFTPQLLERRLARKRTPVKPALLDQHVVAGMGNRDADESLWRARIDPRRPANDLTYDESSRLTEAMQAVLAEGISRRGTMPDLWGNRGTQLEHRQVFERTGKPCPRCGQPIHQIRQNGRNTFYCAHCQQ